MAGIDSQGLTVPVERVLVIKNSVVRVEKPGSKSWPREYDKTEKLWTSLDVARRAKDVEGLVHGALSGTEEGLVPGKLAPGVLCLLPNGESGVVDQVATVEQIRGVLPPESMVYEVVEIVRAEVAGVVKDTVVALKETDLTVARVGEVRAKKYGGPTPEWASQVKPAVTLKRNGTATKPVEASSAVAVVSSAAAPDDDAPQGQGAGGYLAPAAFTAAEVSYPGSIPAERTPANYAAIVAIIGREKLAMKDASDVLVLDLEPRDLPLDIAAKIRELGLKEVKVGTKKYTVFSGETAQLILLMSFLDAKKVRGKHSSQVQGFLGSELPILREKVAALSSRATPASVASSDGCFSMGEFVRSRQSVQAFRDLEPGLAQNYRVVNASGRADFVFVVLGQGMTPTQIKSALAAFPDSTLYGSGVMINVGFGGTVSLCAGLEAALARRAPGFKFFFLEDKSKDGYRRCGFGKARGR